MSGYAPYGDSGYRSSNVSGRLLMALLIAGISLFSYWQAKSRNPLTNRMQHVSMSVNQEIGMGLQAVPEMEAQYGGIAHDSAGRERVERVGRQLVSHTIAANSNYRFQFHLLADPETVNAFALPGGQIFITEGLLKHLKTDGQLAGVLGHEMGHVIERHGAQHLAKARLTQGLTGAAVIATYDPNNPRTRYNAAIAAAIGQLVNLRFTRNDELEADQWGVRLTADAGYDPRSMIEVMEILKESSKGRAPPEFFSTHPNPEHREERIRRAIQTAFPHGVPGDLIQ